MSEFCDLVWLEIWDDCPAMGDQPRYREIIQGVFYEGRDSAWVESTMANAERRRKDPKTPDISRPLPDSAVDTLRKMKERFGKQAPPVE